MEDMSTNEIDLHGYRLHEAEEATTKFVDNAYFRNELSVRIIHGFGVIAESLPKWLEAYPFVVGFERDPGNPGATIVKLESH
ncbi:MAG: hypothetical protein COV46_02540 [Deltaproteobacteria bacterium CG11_big_fil_rev_8_21_14_0_20_49_13]|nr:MAG: hypothetical protein COV46_02540 [Deltaproteobacteria bacterium CG11_big_fil_rev_8_21_14_0_20_49_13]